MTTVMLKLTQRRLVDPILHKLPRLTLRLILMQPLRTNLRVMPLSRMLRLALKLSLLPLIRLKLRQLPKRLLKRLRRRLLLPLPAERRLASSSMPLTLSLTLKRFSTKSTTTISTVS